MLLGTNIISSDIAKVIWVPVGPIERSATVFSRTVQHLPGVFCVPGSHKARIQRLCEYFELDVRGREQRVVLLEPDRACITTRGEQLIQASHVLGQCRTRVTARDTKDKADATAMKTMQKELDRQLALLQPVKSRLARAAEPLSHLDPRDVSALNDFVEEAPVSAAAASALKEAQDEYQKAKELLSQLSKEELAQAAEVPEASAHKALVSAIDMVCIALGRTSNGLESFQSSTARDRAQPQRHPL